MVRWKQAGGAIILLAALHGDAAAWDDDCAGSAYHGYVWTAAAEPKSLEVRAQGLAAGPAAAFADTTTLYLGEPGLVYRRRAWFALRQGEFGYGLGPTSEYCCGGESVVNERFVVVGLPPGTEVELRLRLDYEARVERTECDSDCDYSVFTGIDFPTGWQWNSRGIRAPVGTSVEAWSHQFVFRVRAGEEFPIRFSVSQGSGARHQSVDTAVRWSFPGLAPGVGVSSCLASAGPTPVRAATWGAVKAHYR